MNDIELIQSTEFRRRLAKKLERPIDDFTLPKKLFQYRKFASYSIENILKNQITGRSPNYFDDTFDSYMHFNTDDKIKDDLLKVKSGLEEAGIPGRGNFIDDEYIRRIIASENEKDDFVTEKMREKITVSCFSKTKESKILWALYAQDSTGLCIEYNFNEANNNLDKFFYPVIYIAEPIDIASEIRNGNILDALILSSITKEIAWQDQEEWRFIIPMSNNNTFLPIKNIPKPVSITFGTQFDITQLTVDEVQLFKQLIEFVIKEDIKLYKCFKSRGSYKFEINQIDKDFFESV